MQGEGEDEVGTSPTPPGGVLVAAASAGAGEMTVTGSTLPVVGQGETEFSPESLARRGASLEAMQRGTGRTHQKQHTSSVLVSKLELLSKPINHFPLDIYLLLHLHINLLPLIICKCSWFLTIPRSNEEHLVEVSWYLSNFYLYI